MARRLGQHFLARQSILEKIAAAACPESEPLVVEIGPGKGALTERLLRRAGRVVAIEVDTYLMDYLRQKFREEPRLTLLEGDVLKTDLAQWGPAVVAGNLPYYITSPILERLFTQSGAWRRAVFLVQQEVAERLTCGPGTRAFGYLTVETNLYAKTELLFPVSRTAFRPPPRVESAVVRLTPRDATGLDIADRAAFLRFAALCFRHKRKTLRNNLLDAYGRARAEGLPEASLRAEQLSLEQLAAVYRRLNPA